MGLRLEKISAYLCRSAGDMSMMARSQRERGEREGDDDDDDEEEEQ